ncbi:MAG: hypothetical protein WCN88_02840 [Candidatus Falkowbacteria bacterium]
MRKNLKLISSLLILTAILILPYFVFAQNTDDKTMLGTLTSVAQTGGYATGDSSNLMTVVGTVIRAVLGLLGAIFIILMIIAGYSWMTASGNEQKVEKALSSIKRAVIGLVITLSSYAIWTFIFDKLIKGGK